MGAWKNEYLESLSNTYGGVCLNCGSGKCGFHGGCRDKAVAEVEKNKEPESQEERNGN
jgi:hypothetical protein